jgi:hypothetical protein
MSHVAVWIPEQSVTGAYEVTPGIHGDMPGAFLERFRGRPDRRDVARPLASYEQTQSFLSSLRDRDRPADTVTHARRAADHHADEEGCGEPCCHEGQHR